MAKTELKEVFIYNETYPLPKDAYIKYKDMVNKCTGNDMCLNRAKTDVEDFISKWGRKNGKKIEEGDESGFTILGESQEFFGEKSADGSEKFNYVKLTGVISIFILAAIAVHKKSILFGVATLAVATLIFIPSTQQKLKDLFVSAKGKDA